MLAPLALTLALQAGADRFTAEQVVQDLEALAGAVRAEWSYFEARAGSGEVDLDALLARAREQVGAGCTRDELAVALRELVAGLHDGHAGLFVPGESGRVRRRLPLALAPVAEGVAVRAIAASAEIESGGASAGDLVLAIDGASVAELLAREERSAFGSTPGMRRLQACRALEWSEAQERVLELEGAGGARRQVRVRTLDAEPLELARAARGALPELRWPGDGIAVLRIPSFALADWTAWLGAAPEERDRLLAGAKQHLDGAVDAVRAGGARGLVLDLRGNAGGTDLLGIHLAQRLLEKPFVYFRLSAREDGRWTAPAGLTYVPRDPVYGGPLALLIDAGTFSAASNFARCLDDLHPALTVVGRPDGAGTGAPRAIARLPHSAAEITLCTQRVCGPTSDLTEGIGTTPERAVSWTADDLRAGRDPDLQAALELLLAARSAHAGRGESE